MSNDNVSMHELQQVVDRVTKLSNALRAAGLKVVVTTNISLSFEVRIEDPAARRAGRASPIKLDAKRGLKK